MSKKQLLLLAALTTGCASGVAPACKKTPPVEQPPPAARAYQKKIDLPPPSERPATPGFAKSRGWLNASRAPTDAELRGRVVVVDFWTSACINCMHTLPTLARLEKKHEKDPFLVVGVHTQKFDAEPEVERLRASVIRYGIAHPVAIDGDRGIWEAWGVSAWPTVIVLDTKGRVVFEEGGEPDEAELDAVIESALAEGAEQNSLANEAPQFLAREVDTKNPLAFPEKIAKVPGGLAIADSGHDRIVFTDDGGNVLDIVGGGRGLADGDFKSARFAHPQGMVASTDLLYVADTENHAIRVIDRKAKTVSTIAGNGKLGTGRLDEAKVDAKSIALRSPWDLAIVNGTLYVALAGSHQIATLDPAKQTIQLFAGTGRESISDGPRLKATFAQPSGLATDGKNLFVLDSETSSVRKIDLQSGEVSTLVGKGLFVFGDKDGPGDEARLQHPIGLSYGGAALWVADTYNSKLKRVDPSTGETKTIATGFSEPAGLVALPGSVSLVADTNRDRIVRVDLATGATTPFAIGGLH